MFTKIQPSDDGCILLTVAEKLWKSVIFLAPFIIL